MSEPDTENLSAHFRQIAIEAGYRRLSEARRAKLHQEIADRFTVWPSQVHAVLRRMIEDEGKIRQKTGRKRKPRCTHCLGTGYEPEPVSRRRKAS